MYESLFKHSRKFHLYIFAFDEITLTTLNLLKLSNVTVISLAEFEDENLLQIKKERTALEYCWTCTPSTILYAIEKYNLESCTYIDADLYFYQDPSIIIEELGEKSVLITEHRYTPQYDQSHTSGIYCVQFITFKNNEQGREVLLWWRNACIEWCFARVEEGKFGDQKYLDDWPMRFKGIHIMSNIGGGIAPWNIQQFDVEKHYSQLVFYHFHNFKFIGNSNVDFGHYKLKSKTIQLLYVPYLLHLNKINEEMNALNERLKGCYKTKQLYSWKTSLRKIKRILKGVNNVFNIERVIEKYGLHN